MAYRHISNLYKDNTILLFKRCYALEKAHGTSSHLSYSAKTNQLNFFSGGAKYEQFLALFNQEELLTKFQANAAEHPNIDHITIFGEAYGGKLQGMSATYGPDLKFVAFEVCADGIWFDVPRAEGFVAKFDIEFVPYVEIETTEEAINAQRDADSVIAVRNGMGPGHMREGIVLRPITEFVHQGENGGTIRSKHKRKEFEEREHVPKFNDPEKLKVLEESNAIADEWVTGQRLNHVLDKLYPNEAQPEMEDAQKIIAAMINDIKREAKDEIVESKDLDRAIGKRTAKLLKQYLERDIF